MKDMLDVRPIAGAASKSGCDALESLPIVVRPPVEILSHLAGEPFD
jgi:hypothetical protein